MNSLLHNIFYFQAMCIPQVQSFKCNALKCQENSSNTSIDYSGFHTRLLPPYCALAEWWRGGRYQWRPFSACWCLIDLNLATWHCQSHGGSIEMEFVGASTVTSGWRGVVTSLCLLGSSSPDHTRSLKKQQTTAIQGRLYRHCRDGSYHTPWSESVGSLFVLFLHIGFEINNHSRVEMNIWVQRFK